MSKISKFFYIIIVNFWNITNILPFIPASEFYLNFIKNSSNNLQYFIMDFIMKRKTHTCMPSPQIYYDHL